MKVKRKKRESALKKELSAAGVTYDEVAACAGVSWRMVKYVIDGQRTSRKVTDAIHSLTRRTA